MTLTPEVVATYKELSMNPAAHGLPIRPLKECFEVSEKVTANHILAADYITNESPNMPKVILYIIMAEVYGPCRLKDENGNLGYALTFKQNKP